MLVLTRKYDESIIINDNIEVVVVGIQGDKIKLGINAPRDISVHRKEIWMQIKENENADLNLGHGGNNENNPHSM